VINEQFTQEINRLKNEQRWDELNDFYTQLSEGASTLEQRLFFDWERATLLATELNRPSGAMHVLKKAAVAGGPLEVIAPQIEAIRIAASDNMKVLFAAQQSYQTLLRHAPLSRVSVEIQKWLRDVTEIIETQSHVHTDQSDDELDESILDSVDIIEEELVLQPHLSPQETAIGFQSGSDKLMAQLTAELASSKPLKFMHDLKEYVRTKPLNPVQKELIEPLLWRAATEGGEWRLWVQLYEQCILNLSSETPSPDRTFKLASILEIQLKDYDRAVELYSLTLHNEPKHDEAFDRLRSLLKTTQKWDLLGKLLLEFAKISVGKWSIEDRFEMCLEAGDCYIQQLKNSAKAITAWFQGLELNPESKQIFVRLVEVYQKNQKWAACIKVLRKLSILETDQTKASFHLYNIGLIQRDHLRDNYLAVRSFDEALDLDPSFMKAFQAIDDTLDAETQDLGVTERRDRYYRKMLIRAVEHQFESSMIAELALQVGKINGSILAKWEEAKRAYELVLDYEPMRDEAHLGLVEVTAQLEGVLASIQSAFVWVRRSPQQPLAYLALFERSMQAQSWDQAWCAAITLAALEHTTPDVNRHLEAGRELLGSQLERVIHPSEWRLLEWAEFEWKGPGDEWGSILSILGGRLVTLCANPPRAYGINLKRDLVLGDDSTMVARVVHYICQYLNITQPLIWLNKPTNGALITPVYLSEGRFGIALNREVCGQLSVEELACTLTVSLILSQPNTMLALHPNRDQILNELQIALSSQGWINKGEQKKPSNPKRVQAMQTMLKTLSPQDINELRGLCQQVGSVDRWVLALEQTAYRASLLICSDPRLIQMLMNALGVISSDQESERRYKLLLYSVSPPYLKLREQLNLAWG
jgi:golgin subfamily B member 1